MTQKWIIALPVICAISFSSCRQKKVSSDQLRSDIQNKLTISKANFGFAFKDLQTGETVFLHEKESFHAASTMKTPVLIELYRQAAAGKFSLSDSILIKNTFSSIVDGSAYSLDSTDDSEKELYKETGRKRTIRSLAYNMIILSSNLSTNLLIELVKADSVMHTMKTIGAKDINVLRGVEDNKAFEKGLNNTTTAFDLLLLFEQMAKHQLVNEQSSTEMINILLDQKFNEIIPALLPKEVKVAHKTGSITGIQHDCGIVFLPDGRKYVLVLLAHFDPPDEQKVISAMASVSKLVYDYMQQKAVH